jgi:hypothetical protein
MLTYAHVCSRMLCPTQPQLATLSAEGHLELPTLRGQALDDTAGTQFTQFTCFTSTKGTWSSRRSAGASTTPQALAPPQVLNLQGQTK